MIDLGISKLMLIGVVALVVIGPEKLPRVARTVGTLLGRAQRYVNEVKTEVSQQMELDELNKMKKSVEEAAKDIQKSVDETKRDVYKAQQDIESQIQDVSPKPSTTDSTAISSEIKPIEATTATPVSSTSASSSSGTLRTLPPPTKPVSELQRLGQESLRDMVRKVNGKPPEEKRDFQQKCRAQRMATPMWYKRRARAKNSLLSSAARSAKS